MNVLLISEHYSPKVGGTVSYVKNTALNMCKKEVNVFLLIPAIGEIGKIKEVNHPENNLKILQVGVTTTNHLGYNQEERTRLCNYIKNNIIEITQQYHIDVVHLLYGLFIAEILDTKSLQSKGIKTIHTIHNIPPFECSNSWKGDEVYFYIKDEFRKIGVRFINKKRIKKNPFDVYITPSQIIKNELGKYVNSNKIHIIGHGGAEHVISKQNKESTPINILTVGGIVPHKNQLLIPKIAAHLLKNKIDFKWDIVGPVRNQRYYKALEKDIHTHKVDNTVFIHTNVDKNTLNSFYNTASIYIQLSNEEGFCMTVLDAISHNIPVLAVPAGAIPEMLEKVGGTIIEKNLTSLKLMITHFLKINPSLNINDELLVNFKKEYTWENAVEKLIQLYHE